MGGPHPVKSGPQLELPPQHQQHQQHQQLQQEVEDATSLHPRSPSQQPSAVNGGFPMEGELSTFSSSESCRKSTSGPPPRQDAAAKPSQLSQTSHPHLPHHLPHTQYPHLHPQDPNPAEAESRPTSASFITGEAYQRLSISLDGRHLSSLCGAPASPDTALAAAAAGTSVAAVSALGAPALTLAPASTLPPPEPSAVPDSGTVTLSAAAPPSPSPSPSPSSQEPAPTLGFFDAVLPAAAAALPPLPPSAAGTVAVAAVVAAGPPARYSSSGASTDFESALLQQLHTIDGVHAVFGSDQLGIRVAASSVPNPRVIAAVAGTGLAPWEIHRPQKFVRDLVLRGCFSGRVLDAGCGIGDNALFVAKACPGASVVAVDVVARCLDFASTKAGLRGMRHRLAMAVGDLRQYDSLPDHIRTGPLFDIVLDSYTFDGFSDPDRVSYMATLHRLLRPGGVMYMTCLSEAETRPGGSRRVSEQELRGVLHTGSGWQLEAAEETVMELHPTFWGGKACAHLFTARRL